MKKTILILTLMIFLVLAASSQAATYAFVSEADVGSGIALRESSATNNYGACGDNPIGGAAGGNFRTLMNWSWICEDVVGLYAISSIGDAKLQLYCGGNVPATQDASFDIYPMKTVWEEGAACEGADYSTWAYNLNGDDNWLGTDNTNYDETDNLTVTAPNSISNGEYFNITLDPAYFQKLCIDGGLGLYDKGFIIIDNVGEAADEYIACDSDDGTNKPVLYITEGVDPPLSDTLNMSSPSIPTNSQFDITTINFNVTLNTTYDDVNNCTLYINQTINKQEISIPGGENIQINLTQTFTEGTYIYDLSCMDNTTVRNSTGHIFFIDYTPPTALNNIDGNIFTYFMDFWVNVTDNSNNVTLLINDSGTYNYYNNSAYQPLNKNDFLNVSGYGLGSKQTNITYCDAPNGTALNCVSEVFSWENRGRLNITAVGYDGKIIYNFSIYVNGSLDGSTLTGQYNLDSLVSTDYNISIYPSGYAIGNITKTVTSTYDDLAFTLYTTNSINFLFLNEVTKDLINNTNITIELIGDLFSGNWSTDNGTKYLDLLSPSFYTIRYNAPDFYERFYYFTLINRTYTDLTLYLVNETDATEISATVYDEANNELEGAYIKVLRYDLSTNSYIFVEQARTNWAGDTKLHVIKNSEYYKFYIYYPFTTFKKATTPTYIYDDVISFQIATATPTAQHFYNTMGLDYSLTYNELTDNFRFEYSDINNLVKSGRLDIFTLSPKYGKTLLNSTSIDGASGTILINVPRINDTTYYSEAWVAMSPDYYLTGLTHTYYGIQHLGSMGLIGVMILTLIFAFVGFWRIEAAVILVPIPMLIGAITGFIDIMPVLAVGIEILAIIIAVVINKQG